MGVVMNCPICSELAIASCKCIRGDSVCASAHHWHTCVVHNKVVIGISDHSLPMDTCTCIADSEVKGV
jgi:hypothetical protein